MALSDRQFRLMFLIARGKAIHINPFRHKRTLRFLQDANLTQQDELPLRLTTKGYSLIRFIPAIPQSAGLPTDTDPMFWSPAEHFQWSRLI